MKDITESVFDIPVLSSHATKDEGFESWYKNLIESSSILTKHNDDDDDETIVGNATNEIITNLKTIIKESIREENENESRMKNKICSKAELEKISDVPPFCAGKPIVMRGSNTMENNQHAPSKIRYNNHISDLNKISKSSSTDFSRSRKQIPTTTSSESSASPFCISDPSFSSCASNPGTPRKNFSAIYDSNTMENNQQTPLKISYSNRISDLNKVSKSSSNDSSSSGKQISTISSSESSASPFCIQSTLPQPHVSNNDDTLSEGEIHSKGLKKNSVSKSFSDPSEGEWTNQITESILEYLSDEGQMLFQSKVKPNEN